MRIEKPGKEQNVFTYLIQYKTENDGLSPSYRDICKYCNVKSTSTVQYYLVKLKKQGKVEFTKGVSGIRVVGGRWEYIA